MRDNIIGASRAGAGRVDGGHARGPAK